MSISMFSYLELDVSDLSLYYKVASCHVLEKKKYRYGSIFQTILNLLNKWYRGVRFWYTPALIFKADRSNPTEFIGMFVS